METSQDDINQLLRIWAAKNVLEDGGTVPYENFHQLYDTIDAIPYGDTPWHSFRVRYSGPVTPDSPAWQQQTYVIHTRNAEAAIRMMAASDDFEGKFDYVAYEEYVGPNNRRWSNLMSGRWAYKQSVSPATLLVVYSHMKHNGDAIIQDAIAQDPNTHGSMLLPIILGADKTTVSVATGNQEFHPLYASVGNIHNEMRRAHRDALIPLAFLAIPKGSRMSSLLSFEYHCLTSLCFGPSITRVC